ncbi:MAG TPA: triple tyrosine motif-containing protein, partial [Acidobacteriota bacterium]|nr:triple tyrosine motif-containing protein [Acidobacteriota bacterium]
MKRFILFCIWVVCFAGSCVSVIGQDKPLSEVGFHFIRKYSVDDYQASPQNWSVVQDLRGVLYFANNSGVLEFDGLHWRLIKVKNESPVGALAVDPKTGRIYVGAVDEFGYLKPDSAGQLQYESMRHLVPPNTQAIHLIHKILITPSEVFFRPEDQIVRWDGHQITLFNPTTSEDWYGRAFHIGDRIVVRHQSHGLIEWKQGKFELIPGSERFGQLGVYTILPFDSNRWLLFTPQGMMLYDGLAFTAFAPEMTAFLKAVLPYGGLVLPDGRFAINTLNNGVVILNRQGRVDEIINKASGLGDNAVKYLYLDREGGMWAAMETGLARIEISPQLTFFDERSGLQGLVTAITRYRGDLYVATVSGVYTARPAAESSVLELTSLRTPTFLKVEGLSTQCWVFEQVGDQLLVASNDGIYRIDQLKATPVSPISTACLFQSAHFPGKLVVPDRNGHIFLLAWKQNQWAIESELFDIKAEPRVFQEMPTGEWWIATKTNGLKRVIFDSHQLENKTEIRNLQIKDFGIREGLPALEIPYPLIVHTQLLVGTQKGLVEFDPNTQCFKPASGFITEPGVLPIIRIALDANGIVWGNFDKDPQIQEEQLVGRWIPQADGSARWQRSQLGLVPDGLVMNFLAEPDQTVWICSVRGLFRYSPHQKVPEAQEIPLLLRLLKDDQKTVWFEGTNFSNLPAIPALEYANNRINMVVAGLTFSLETPLEYQFKLDGVDTNWLPWSRQSVKEYTNLWEGTYQLRVRARNIYGQMSRETLFSFSVFPPWYRTWWAYGLYIAGLAGLGYGGINWRLKILRRRNEELEQLVALRTSELKDKVQELAQKNEELVASQRQADRIFTAFTEALPGTVLDGKY